MIDIINTIFKNEIFARYALDNFCSDRLFNNIHDINNKTITQLKLINENLFVEDSSIFFARLLYNINKISDSEKVLDTILFNSDSYFWALESLRYKIKYGMNIKKKEVSIIERKISEHFDNYNDHSTLNPHFSYWPLWMTPKIAGRYLNFIKKELKTKNKLSCKNHDFRFFMPSVYIIASNKDHYLIQTRSGINLLLEKFLIYVPEFITKFDNCYKIIENDDVTFESILNKYKLTETQSSFIDHIENYSGFSLYNYFGMFIAVGEEKPIDFFEENFLNRDGSFYSNEFTDIKKIIDLNKISKSKPKKNNEEVIISENFLKDNNHLIFKDNSFFCKYYLDSNEESKVIFKTNNFTEVKFVIEDFANLINERLS